MTGPPAAPDLCDWCGRHGTAEWEFQRADDGLLEHQRRVACHRHLDAALQTMSHGGATFRARRLPDGRLRQARQDGTDDSWYEEQT